MRPGGKRRDHDQLPAVRAAHGFAASMRPDGNRRDTLLRITTHYLPAGRIMGDGPRYGCVTSTSRAIAVRGDAPPRTPRPLLLFGTVSPFPSSDTRRKRLLASLVAATPSPTFGPVGPAGRIRPDGKRTRYVCRSCVSQQRALPPSGRPASDTSVSFVDQRPDTSCRRRGHGRSPALRALVARG